MPAGRWGSDSGEGDLEHEVALAAALDRSRTDLNPDAETSARMKADFFARLAQEWDAPLAAPPEADTERTMRIEPVRAEVDLAPALAEALAETRDLGPTPLEPTRVAETTVDAAAGSAEDEDEPSEGGTVVPFGRRKARHTLPRNHQDNPRRPSARRRVVLVGAAASVGLVALLGGTAAMSQSALPGDSLYAMKLMSEDTGTAFTFGDAAKAQRHLDIAATRLQEIERLRQAGTTPDAATYRSALTAFDAAASEGSRMVLASPDQTEAGMGDLGAWAHRQSDTLAALQGEDAQVPGASDSARLMDRIAERSAALQDRMGCTEVSDGVDDLGPIPAEGPCVPAATDSSGATSPQAGSRQSARTEGTTTPSGTETVSPSGTDTTTPDDPALLDGVVPGSSDATTTTTGEPSSSTESGSTQSTTSTTTKSGGLLPPISLPPLLPGLPSITLG